MTEENAFVEEIPARSPESPLVTAIVSTYKSERFMRGLLDDLEGQTIADQLEIVIVDSDSPENEREIILEYQKKHDNIHYVRTKERETIYAAWNRAIKLARGTFISNANTDDRHRADAYERMVEVLEANPDVGAAYANVLVTERINETFENNTANNSYKWMDFTLRDILRGCFFGPQPMWRKSVHDEIGEFRGDYVSAGDYDFAIKVGWKCGAIHIREALGLYVKRPDSIEHAEINHGSRETAELQQFHRDMIPIEDIYPDLVGFNDRVAHANALFDLGNVCVQSNAAGQGMKFYAQALGIKPNLLAVSHNMALLRAISNQDPQAIQDLQRMVSQIPLAAQNLAVMGIHVPGARQVPHGTGPTLIESDHPTVENARRGLGVNLGPSPSGSLRVEPPKTSQSQVHVIINHKSTDSNLKNVLAGISVDALKLSQVTIRSDNNQANDSAGIGELTFTPEWSSTDLPELAGEALSGSQSHLLIMSSDISLPKGWLGTLLSYMSHQPKMAAIGPCSNSAPKPQAVSLSPSNPKKIIQFTKKRALSHKGRWAHVPYLSPTCVLLSKELVNEAGGLDANSSDPMWDLYTALRDNSMVIACAQDVFAYKESLSEAEGKNYDALFAEANPT